MGHGLLPDIEATRLQAGERLRGRAAQAFGCVPRAKLDLSSATPSPEIISWRWPAQADRRPFGAFVFLGLPYLGLAPQAIYRRPFGAVLPTGTAGAPGLCLPDLEQAYTRQS